MGLDEAARVLAGIDDYYADVNRRPEAVATQLARQLADPRPRDAEVTAQLATYKALDPRWHEWSAVTAVLAEVAQRMAERYSKLRQRAQKPLSTHLVANLATA